MKNKLISVILLLLVGVFLINLSSAWTYSNSDYPPAYCSITESDTISCEGRAVGSYCVGRWYVDVSHSGDVFKLYTEAASWPSCTDSGCSGGTTISDGKIYPTTSTGMFAKHFILAWDSNSGSWCWQAGGWTGSGALGNWQNVVCYDNSDCGSGKICSKTGSPNQWACIVDPCAGVTCPDKCEGFYWKTLGSCSNGACVYSGSNLVIGKCGVNCLTPSNCGTNGFVDGTKTCSGNDLMQIYRTYSCNSYQCSQSDALQKVQTCTYQCSNGACLNDPCSGITCNDKCEGNLWKTGGSCSNGVCSYSSSRAIEGMCGNPTCVSPKTFDSTTATCKIDYKLVYEKYKYYIFGLIGLLVILIIYMIFRKKRKKKGKRK